MDIRNLVVLELNNTCGCNFSGEYLTDLSLTCQNREDEIAICQARVISTAEKMNTLFLQLLQNWARDEPLVTINHMHLRLVMECSVELHDIGETECVSSDSTLTPPLSTSPTNGSGNATTTNLLFETLYACISLAILTTTLAVICILITYCSVKLKARKNKRQKDPM